MDLFWKQAPASPTIEQLQSIFPKFVRLSRQWWQYGIIGEDKGAVIEQEVVPRFASRHHLVAEKAREIFIILSHPRKQTVLNLEKILFLTICLKISGNLKLSHFLKKKQFDLILKNKDANRLIQQYLKDYFWIKTDFYQAGHITTESLLNNVSLEIKKKSRRQIKAEIYTINQNFKKIDSRRKKLLKKIKLTHQDQNDIKFAQQTIYWVDERKRGMMKQLHYFSLLIERMADLFSTSYHELTRYNVDELNILLKTGRRIANEIMLQRKKNYIVVYEKDKPGKYFYGVTGKELFNFVMETKNKLIHSGYISGIVASSGGKKDIEGKVRVVQDPQGAKFKSNEILVTSMTRVEFVPLIHKARAIITDEGGLACHAAIVARELNIPAIIGTKVATQVFKTGDLVSMDLKSGRIKKI